MRPGLIALLLAVMVASVATADVHVVADLEPGMYAVRADDALIQEGLVAREGRIEFVAPAYAEIRVTPSPIGAAQGPLVTAGGVRVFPNPSRGRVSLAWTAATAGRVTLTVYDAGGRRVGPLLHRTGQIGHNVWPLELELEARGVCLVRLDFDGETRTGRVVLQKGRAAR